MTFDDLRYLYWIAGLIDRWEGGQGQAHTRLAVEDEGKNIMKLPFLMQRHLMAWVCG